MKKFYISILFVFLLLISAGSFAKNHHHNMVDPNSPYINNQKITIKELEFVHDDEYVVLEGYIVKKINSETYLFRDYTGEIQLDIDNDINYMLKNVNEKTLVEISGEYDRNRFKSDEVEVENIKIIKQE